MITTIIHLCDILHGIGRIFGSAYGNVPVGHQYISFILLLFLSFHGVPLVQDMRLALYCVKFFNPHGNVPVFIFHFLHYHVLFSFHCTGTFP